MDIPSNWRDIGDTTIETYRAQFEQYGSPMLGELEDVYEAAKPHSALILAKMWVEQKYATLSSIPEDFHNPCSLAKPEGGIGLDRWEQYGSFSEGVKACVDRITSPTYKPSNPGVYARTTSLRDLIYVFAPPSENDTERYIAQASEKIREFPRLQQESPVALQFGRVENPGYFDRPIWKPEGQGQNYLGDRVLRGMVLHRMIGTLPGTDAYFRMAGVFALTDWGVGTEYTDGKSLAGVIYRWNSVDTNQSGWASGPWEGGSQKGRNFVNKFGVSAINRDLESIEVSGKRYTDPIDDFTLEEIAELIAWRADSIRIPWDVFPLNPFTGLPFLYNHSDFQAHKPCSGDVLKAEQARIERRAKEIMQMAQTGGKPNQPGPVVPGKPVMFVAFPRQVVMHLIPGSVSRKYGYVPKGDEPDNKIRQYSKRTAVKVVGYYLGEEVAGRNEWLVLRTRGISDNARVHVSGFEEPIPTFSAATRVQPVKGSDQNRAA